MQQQKRLDYLDMAKGIAMVLVLLGHLQGDQIYALSPYFHPMCVFIFSFHMPFFFIVAGILAAIRNDEAKPFGELAMRRFRGIMIPYYWFSLFYLLIVLWSLIKGAIAIQTLLIQIWYVLSGYGMNVLWFLPAFYLGELLFFHLKKVMGTDKRFIITVIICSAVMFAASFLLTKWDTEDLEFYTRVKEFARVLLRPFIVCMFMAIGYYVHKLLCKDTAFGRFILSPKLNEKGKVVTSVRIFYIAIGLVLLGICFAFMRINNGIDVRTMVLRNVPAFMLCSLSGSYGLLMICKGLPRIRLFTYWGVGSLIFMATHNSETVLYYAMRTAMYVNQYLTRARGYICYAIIVTVILVYVSIMIYVIQKFFPFILGKKYSRNK